MDWTITNTTLAAAFTVLNIIDWRQTVSIAQQPERFHETCCLTRSLIGSHPSHGSVNRYFLLSGIIKTALPAFIPTPYREALQSIWIMETGAVVLNNHAIGIHFNF